MRGEGLGVLCVNFGIGEMLGFDDAGWEDDGVDASVTDTCLLGGLLT